MIKQRGGMLAKGRLLGLQFIGLFENNRYLTAAEKANGQAMRIRQAFEKKGIPFLIPSPTNQQFPILTDGQLAALAPSFSWDYWEKLPDGRNAVRFCTSWATKEEAVEALVSAIQGL
jgi:threonine aldolase